MLQKPYYTCPHIEKRRTGYRAHQKLPDEGIAKEEMGLGGVDRLPFAEFAVLLLPLEEMTGQHIHHFHTAKVLEVFLRRYWPGRSTLQAYTLDGRGEEWMLAHKPSGDTVCPVTIAGWGGALPCHSHFDLHA